MRALHIILMPAALLGDDSSPVPDDTAGVDDDKTRNYPGAVRAKANRPLTANETREHVLSKAGAYSVYLPQPGADGLYTLYDERSEEAVSFFGTTARKQLVAALRGHKHTDCPADITVRQVGPNVRTISCDYGTVALRLERADELLVRLGEPLV